MSLFSYSIHTRVRNQGEKVTGPIVDSFRPIWKSNQPNYAVISLTNKIYSSANTHSVTWGVGVGCVFLCWQWGAGGSSLRQRTFWIKEVLRCPLLYSESAYELFHWQYYLCLNSIDLACVLTYKFNGVLYTCKNKAYKYWHFNMNIRRKNNDLFKT